MRRLRFVLAMVAALGAALPAAAQGSAPNGLAGLLLRFFSPTHPVVLRANAVPAFSHAAHFVSQPAAQATLRQINQGIAQQLSTFPLGSSSAGFSFSFDPELGVFKRSTESFGPAFAERPLTAGKGKLSFGVNALHATYDRFQGQDLRKNDIQLYLTHRDVDGDGSDLSLWFEGDVIRADLSIKLVNDTTVAYASYGLTDRLDVGIAVPYTRLDLEATILTTIERLATSGDPFVIHIFDDGKDSHLFPESGHAQGIGDLVLRAKYNFVRRDRAGLAAALDLRLPTGDENDLLGSGSTQTKLLLIGGLAPAKRFSPRAALGYTFSSGGADVIGKLPNELNYSAGFDAVLHPRVTFAADFIGRTLLDANRFVEQDRVFRFRTRTDPTIRETMRRTPGSDRGSLNVLLGSAGVKINPVGRLLVVGNLLFSLGSDGLQDKLTPVLGLEYDF